MSGHPVESPSGVSAPSGLFSRDNHPMHPAVRSAPKAFFEWHMSSAVPQLFSKIGTTSLSKNNTVALPPVAGLPPPCCMPPPLPFDEVPIVLALEVPVLLPSLSTEEHANTIVETVTTTGHSTKFFRRTTTSRQSPHVELTLPWRFLLDCTPIFLRGQWNRCLNFNTRRDYPEQEGTPSMRSATAAGAP